MWGITEVQLIRREVQSLTLLRRGPDQGAAQALTIPCPDARSAEWLASTVEAVFASANASKP